MRRNVKMGDVLDRISRPVDLENDDYPLVGLHLSGKGAFLREMKSGLDIRKKRHFEICDGDVVFNKLFAWKGAFAIVPSELNGFFVSDKFPTFRLDTTAVEPEFLTLVFRSRSFAKQAEVRSVGLAAMSKFTLNPPRFDELQMFLPSLDEQVAIVTLAAELDRALALAQLHSARIDSCTEALPPALIELLSKQHARMPLGNLGQLLRRASPSKMTLLTISSRSE